MLAEPLTVTAYPLAVATSPVIPPSSLSTVHAAVPGLGDGTGIGGAAAAGAGGNAPVTARRTVPDAAVTTHALHRMPPSLAELTWGLLSARQPWSARGRGLGHGVRRQLGGQRLVHPDPQQSALLPVLRREHLAPLVCRGSRASTASVSAAMPTPVRAEHGTASGQARLSRSTVSSSAASILLITSSSGTLSAPTSASTSRTARTCSSGSACAPSTTCTIRSAWATSSSVERNASTSWCGRCR